MKNKLLSFILFFSLIFLACPIAQKDPLSQAQDALSTHQELLESAKGESLAGQIVQFESRLAKATPFLERDEKDLSKELITAQKHLQKAHDAWRSAIAKMEKIPKTPDEEKAALQSEISSYIQTAESNVQSAQRIIESIKK
ncbi:MAG: hypothetical protein HY819_00160 [Acidobacteria bacterium]|nr:hypothetical protein [Acidobacteriota bacterium]